MIPRFRCILFQYPVSAELETKLTLKDLGYVVTRLHGVKHKWFFIGLQLIDYVKLAEIERERHEEQLSMTKMLSTALSQKHTITWRHIIDVLHIPSIGEQVYAQELEKSFMQDAEERQLSILDGAPAMSRSPTNLNRGD